MIGKPQKGVDQRNGQTVWRVDYREGKRRRQKRFASLREANDFQATVNQLPAPSSPSRPVAKVVPLDGQSVRAVGARWLDAHASEWSPRHLDSNRYLLDSHVYPFVIDGTPMGDLAVGAIGRAEVKALVAAKRHAGFARNTVRLVFRALSGVLGEAVEDEVIPYNPASTIRLGKVLGRKTAAEVEDEDGKAMTAEELKRFLAAAKSSAPALYALYFTGAQTGLRLGELCGLQLADLDLAKREANVCRSLGQECSMLDPKPGPTKTGHARHVDLPTEVVKVLGVTAKGRKALAAAQGWHPVPDWVFLTGNGTPYSQRFVLKDFHRVLVRAGMMPKDRAPGVPAPFTPHSLRHTFATLHLITARDRNVIQYVQQQLGHSSIKVTVDTYGSSIRMRDPEAADRLDALLRST